MATANSTAYKRDTKVPLVFDLHASPNPITGQQNILS